MLVWTKKNDQGPFMVGVLKKQEKPMTFLRLLSTNNVYMKQV